MRRRENNIKRNVKLIGYRDANWIHLAQDRDQCRDLLNTVMNIRIP
jgi:hypothetical protein